MTNVSKEMIDAGARILDPLLSSHCPRQVARDVYAAMEEARGAIDLRVEVQPYTMRIPSAAEVAQDVWREYMRERLAQTLALPERMVRLSATSDGRW